MKERLDEILKADYRSLFDSDRDRNAIRHKAAQLVRLKELCEDLGDYEFAQTVLNEFVQIKDPKTDRIFRFSHRFPHSFFHSHQPQVIIVKGKYDTDYYDASTPQNTANACLEIVKQRLDDDCWYSDVLPEDIDPHGQLNLFEQEPQTDKQRAQNIIDFAAKDPKNLVRAGKLAAEFLMEFEHYEYQGIDFKSVSVGKFST